MLRFALKLLNNKLRKNRFLYFLAVRFIYYSALINYYKLPKSKKKFSNRIKLLIKSNEIHKYKKICIFACYSEKLSTSSKLYIKSLVDINYGVIFVNNLPISKNDLDFLKNNSLMSFNRINIGRDVGAFKDIFLFLSSKGYLDKINLLSFANDSVQFIPGKFSREFQESILKFEKSNSEGLFTHFSNQERPHFQSFFSIIKSCIFASNDYKSFWQNYLPISNREHSIMKGEILISTKIYNKIKNPTILYSTNKLFESFDNVKNEHSKDILNTKIIQLIPSFSRTMRYQSQWNYNQIIKENPSVKLIYKSNINLYLSELIENNNPSHVAAFLYPLFLKCPFIKKDLTSQGSFGMGHALNLYKKCLQISLNLDDLEEKNIYKKLIEEYDQLTVQKGNPYSFRNNVFEGIRLGIYGGFQYDYE